MDRYELSLGAQIQAGLAEAADLYKWDDSRRHRANLLGVPAKLIPTEDEVQQVREGRAQKMAQQQAMETVASVVRDSKGNIAGLARPKAAAA